MGRKELTPTSIPATVSSVCWVHKVTSLSLGTWLEVPQPPASPSVTVQGSNAQGLGEDHLPDLTRQASHTRVLGRGGDGMETTEEEGVPRGRTKQRDLAGYGRALTAPLFPREPVGEVCRAVSHGAWTILHLVMNLG